MVGLPHPTSRSMTSSFNKASLLTMPAAVRETRTRLQLLQSRLLESSSSTRPQACSNSCLSYMPSAAPMRPLRALLVLLIEQTLCTADCCRALQACPSKDDYLSSSPTCTDQPHGTVHLTSQPVGRTAPAAFLLTISRQHPGFHSHKGRVL